MNCKESKYIFIPELNYWINCILFNSPINEKYFKLPIPTSTVFVTRRSVLDLLFNETFQIISWLYPSSSTSESSSSSSSEISSSSSSSEISSSSSSLEELKFFWRYCKVQPCAVSLDKNMSNRLTVYNGCYDFYIANAPVNGFLCVDPNVSDNIFNFTAQELMMLQRLFLYKTDQEVTINDIGFNELDSALSKCIYIYLDWELNESFLYYSLNTSFTDSSSPLLHVVYEKYVLDYLYRILTRQYCVTVEKENIDVFGQMDYDYRRLILTDDNISTKKILINSPQKPYDPKDTFVIHRGFRLKYYTDYEIENETSNTYLLLKSSRYLSGDELYYLWTFLEP